MTIEKNNTYSNHLFKQRSCIMKAINLEANKIANLAGLIVPTSR